LQTFFPSEPHFNLKDSKRCLREQELRYNEIEIYFLRIKRENLDGREEGMVAENYRRDGEMKCLDEDH
jgi:hypothetical protein